MPPTCPQCAVMPAPASTEAAANKWLRAYVRAHGDRTWTRVELDELARLRGVWLEATSGLAEAA